MMFNKSADLAVVTENSICLFCLVVVSFFFFFFKVAEYLNTCLQLLRHHSGLKQVKAQVKMVCRI